MYDRPLCRFFLLTFIFGRHLKPPIMCGRRSLRRRLPPSLPVLYSNSAEQTETLLSYPTNMARKAMPSLRLSLLFPSAVSALPFCIITAALSMRCL